MKKMFALLLAMMMMVLPTMSLASTEVVTISLKHGSAAEALGAGELTDMINELIDLFTFTSYTQDKQGGMTLLADGEAVASIAAQVANDNVYVTSNFVGNKNFAVSRDDLKSLVNAMGLEAEEAETMNTAIDAIFDGSAFENNAGIMDDLDITATVSAAAPLLDQVEVSTEFEQPEGCDPAATCITLTITGEQMNEIFSALMDDVLNTQYYTTLLETMAASGEAVSKDEILEVVSKLFAGEIPVAVYLDEDGMPVYASVNMEMKVDEADQKVSESMTLTRNTVDGVANYQVIIVVDAAENDKVTMVYDIAVIDENHVNLAMNMFYNDELMMTITATVTEENDVADVMMTFNVIDNGETMGIRLSMNIAKTGSVTKTTAALLPLDNDVAYITLYVDYDEDAAEVPGIASDDVIRLVEMTEDDLNSLTFTALSELFNLLQKLPQSVQDMILSNIN